MDRHPTIPLLLAALSGAVLPMAAALGLGAAGARAQGVDVTLAAQVTTVDLGPGFAAEPAWAFDGQVPGPVLRATEGQTIHVQFRNLLPEPTTVHWHGQSLPLEEDGTGGLAGPVVAPGQERRMTLANLSPGTYCYRPLVLGREDQLDRGLAGVLIVDPANPADDPPFDQEQVVVLDDWLQPFGGGYFGHLLNGRTSDGQAAIAVNGGARLRLRIVNVAARTNYVIALQGHPMTVTHCDGHRVQPVLTAAIPIGIGERYDVIVNCTNPGTWSLAASTLENRTAVVVRGVVRYAGQSGPDPSTTLVPQNLAAGALLDYAQLQSVVASPTVAVPNLQTTMSLETLALSPPRGMINGQAWPQIVPTQISAGDVVQLDLQSLTASIGGAYPVHLHGHSFRLLGTAGGATHAPVKDTLLLRPFGSPGSAASVQFTADNPGRWLLHCGDALHLARGMATTVEYSGDSDGDGIGDALDLLPTRAIPALRIPDDGAAFLPGGSGTLTVEWQPNHGCDMLVSFFERVPPLELPPYGTLHLSSLSGLGRQISDFQGTAAFPYALPPLAALSGFRIFLQPMCGSSLLGTVRLGTMSPFWVR